MRLVKSNSRVISVLGMPASGTTIVSNIINSMENAFCLSEPHWALLTNERLFRTDKITLKHQGVNDIMESVVSAIEQPYDYGGVKETYRPMDSRMSPIYDIILEKTDILVVVFRDPKALFNSLKNKSPKKNGMPIDAFARDYLKTRALLEASKPCFSIVLEELCEGGDAHAIEYINRRAGGILRVEGDFSLRRPDFKYGDPKANSSNHIVSPNMSTDLLSEHERRQLNVRLDHVYQGVKT